MASVITLSNILHISTARLSTGRRPATIPTTPSVTRCFRARSSKASKVSGRSHVFHCHDWQSALVPVMLRTLYTEDPAFPRRGNGFHHSQYGLPGPVSLGDSAAPDVALGSAHDFKDGVLRPGKFSEGRAGRIPISSPPSAGSTARRFRPPSTDSDWRACCAARAATVTAL